MASLPLPGGQLTTEDLEIQGVNVDGLGVGPNFGRIKGESMQVSRVVVTVAQLLALKETDVTLVKARGAGLAICVHKVSVRFNFAAVAYTLNAGTLKVYQGPSASAIPLTADLSGVLTPAAVTDIVGAPTITPGAQTQAASENVAIVLGNTGAADFTLGDGTLDVITEYTVLQM